MQLPDSLSITLGQQRIADCLKAVRNFGETVYMDVCSNTSYSVPWGTMDWIAFSALALIIVFGVGLFTLIFLDV